MGQVALPELRRYNYSGALATGALAAGGTLGIMIPPSVPLLRSLLAAYYADTGVRCIRLELSDQLTESRAFERQTRGRFHRGAGRTIRAQTARWIPLHRELVALLPHGVVAGSVDASASPEQVANAILLALPQSLS